jgi:hypothetical protein
MSTGQLVSRRLVLCGALGACLVPIVARSQQPDLAVGQAWSVKSAETTDMKVIIGCIDPGPKGRTIVSVSIVDIPPGDGPTTVGHAPFDAQALIGSLDRVVATGVAPDHNFQAGYDTWKSANGGFFTIGVLEALAAIRAMIEQHHPAAQS